MGFNPNQYKPTNTEGVWESWQGGRFLIAKSGTARHTRIQEEVFAPYKHKLSMPSFSDDKRKELYAEVAAKGILVGWADLFDDSGEEIPYSVDAAAQMLLDIPELLSFVSQFSINHANYRAETVAQTAKKSEKPSIGIGSGEEKISKKT